MSRPVTYFTAAEDRAIGLGVEIGVPALDVAALIGRTREPVRRRAVELGTPFARKRVSAAEKARRIDRLRIAIAVATPRGERRDGNAEEAAHRRACAAANTRFANAMIAAGYLPTCAIAGVWEPEGACS